MFWRVIVRTVVVDSPRGTVFRKQKTGRIHKICENHFHDSILFAICKVRTKTRFYLLYVRCERKKLQGAMNCGYHVKKKPRDKNKIQYSHTPHTLSIFPLTEIRTSEHSFSSSTSSSPKPKPKPNSVQRHVKSIIHIHRLLSHFNPLPTRAKQGIPQARLFAIILALPPTLAMMQIMIFNNQFHTKILQ